MRVLFFFILLVFVLACTKENEIENKLLFRNTDKNYPTVFPKLSDKEIEKRQNEFENNQITFSRIDSFGFVGWSFNDDFEIRKQLHKSTFSDVNALTKRVKQYLVNKSKFTGIKDSSLLIPVSVKPRFQNYGGTFFRSDSTEFNSLYIDFGPQQLNGLEIYNSLLTCMATATGVYHVFGHWYPNVYIPPVDQVSVELAKTVLVGKKLTGFDGWGRELNYQIVEQDLNENRKIIYPFIAENKLELRVCWEFKPSHWQIFMDTSTGEILVMQDVAFYLH